MRLDQIVRRDHFSMEYGDHVPTIRCLPQRHAGWSVNLFWNKGKQAMPVFLGEVDINDKVTLTPGLRKGRSVEGSYPQAFKVTIDQFNAPITTK